MRICIIHQYYKTPKTGGAIRSYYIAKYLHGLGHEVIVVTARNNKAYSLDSSEGYAVHYLPVYYENHLSFLSRIHAFGLFVWKAYRLLKKLPSLDLNYVLTTPLTTGLIAKKAKHSLGIPYIFEVGDLWPDAPIELGVLKNSLLKRLALKWEKSFYNEAERLVALSPDIKEAIQLKAPAKKVDVITNFSDTYLFESSTRNSLLEEKYGTQEHFVISYFGTVGQANHLEYLIAVAAAAKNEKIKFLVVGAGARYDQIKQLALTEKLKNISFYGHRSKLELKELMSITDAVFISFKAVPILSSGSPNKFFDGLAAEKIIIINFKGWIKTLIEENRCGFYYDPDAPMAFVEYIQPYLNSKKLLKDTQRNARTLAGKFTPTKQLATLGFILKHFQRT